MTRSIKEITRAELEQYRAALAEEFARTSVAMLERSSGASGLVVAILTSAILLDDDDAKELIIAAEGPAKDCADVTAHVVETLEGLQVASKAGLN